MHLISKVLIVLAIAFTAGCKSMPDWMPGSGAIRVNLTGAEEVPPLTVPGSGTGSVTTKDVQGTMAHIHRGAKGQNGPIIVPLDKNGDTYSVPAGRKLTKEQMEDLKKGNLYVNVHTATNKGGEVRGQLQP